MSIPLNTLTASIGTAIQKASVQIESVAARAFIGFGYLKDENNELSPITYTLNMPGQAGSKKLNVPITSLINNTSMRLEQTEVKLKFMLDGSSDGGEIMITPASMDMNAFALSELTLTFKNSPPSEGVSRIVTRHNSTI